MRKARFITTVLFLLTLGYFLSAAIHECGHAIVGMMAGIQIRHSQLWPPWRSRVSFVSTAPVSWHAAINLSGMLLTVLVGIVGTLTVSSLGRKWPAIRRGGFVFFPMMFQCLAWVGLPVAMALGAKVQQNDDIVLFTRCPGCNAAVAFAIGLGLMTASATVLIGAFKRGGQQGGRGYGSPAAGEPYPRR